MSEDNNQRYGSTINLDAMFDKPFYQRLAQIANNAVSIIDGLSKKRTFEDLYNIHNEAVFQYMVKRPLAVIYYSSMGVEVCINMDERMEDIRESSHHKWINLSRKCFINAKKRGLPIQALLNEDELNRLDNEDYYIPVFILRRNKLFHGDISGFMEQGLNYKLKEVEVLKTTINNMDYTGIVYDKPLAAYDQLIKFQQYLSDFLTSFLPLRAQRRMCTSATYA